MIGTYFTEDLLQKWFIKNLPTAKAVLGNFKSLNKLLDGFKDYETKRYRDIRNAVMFLCLPEVGDGLNRKRIEQLAELEKAIDFFGVMKWKVGKYNAFKSRLASEEYIQSLSAVTELEVSLKMVAKFGSDNVTLFPELSNGGYSDIGINLNSGMMYLEVGNLGKSVPEIKMEQILNASVEHLGQKTDMICYLCLIIDTAELVFDAKGRIDVDASIKKLNSEIDDLHIHKLAGFEGFFDLNEISYLIANKELYEKMKQWLLPRDQELLDVINNPIITKWLGNFDATLLGKVKLIRSIIAGRGKSTMLVEIHTEGIYPSEAAKSELESFLNHIIRNVKAQIAEQQLEPNTRNIVVVRGHNWLMSLFDPDELSQLHVALQKFYEEKKEDFLSGVVVFDDDLDKAVYVNNDYAKEPSKLTKEDVAKLGFTWLQFEKAKQ
jgi:hypothetical protein